MQTSSTSQLSSVKPRWVLHDSEDSMHPTAWSCLCMLRKAELPHMAHHYISAMWKRLYAGGSHSLF